MRNPATRVVCRFAQGVRQDDKVGVHKGEEGVHPTCANDSSLALSNVDQSIWRVA